MDIDARAYGLSPKIILRELGNNHIGIVKLIKSRIILKDAAKVVAVAGQIKAANDGCKVSLVCTRNICSKSVALLGSEGIDIVYEEL
jgi:predicted Fe-Mo cluster-binding NifX family protein